MIECSVRELQKFYGANKVFENISFEIKEGERIGLIGQNGCGKTTLMKILMGIEDYQGGSINIRKGAQLGYLEQIHHIKGSTEVEEVLWQAFEKATELKKTLQDLEKDFATLTNKLLEQAMAKYGQYMEEYERIDGYQLETKINRICEGLEITSNLRKMSFEDLSGGEKTRVILGRLLLESPDILLLDEPSNHLDIYTIEWLENYLKEYKGTVVVISHDRYFLDRVVTKIYELEPQNMVVYHGNYSVYVMEKERRFIEDFKRYQNQQKQLDRIENQIHRYRVWGAMRDSEVMYKRAKELEKRLEKINVLDRPVLENRRMRMDPSINSRTGKRVITVEGLEKSFEEKHLIREGDFTIFYQDSICLMGANGSGKTTLLKMILGEIQPDKGIIKIGTGVKIGYLPQNIVFDDEEKTLVEYFSYHHNITLGEARGTLAKMLFMQEDVNKKIKNLSGGEKSRLKLCSLTYEKVNLLILDEPTNHLDIESREALEEALMSFGGTLFFVSHDRYFIEKVADQILWIEEGLFQSYPFGYKDFLEKRQRKSEKNRVLHQKPVEKEHKKTPKTKRRESNYGIVLTPMEIEKEIEELEEQQTVILEEIEKNQSDYIILTSLLAEKEQLDGQIKALYAQWESLLDQNEENNN